MIGRTLGPAPLSTSNLANFYYKRPPEFLDLAVIPNKGESSGVTDMFTFLVAVFPEPDPNDYQYQISGAPSLSAINNVALHCDVTNSGSWTVDWGDGNPALTAYHSNFSSDTDGFGSSYGITELSASYEGKSDVIVHTPFASGDPNNGGGRVEIQNTSVSLVQGNNYTITFEYFAASDYSGKFWGTEDGFSKIENEIIDEIGVIYRTFSLDNKKIGLATYEGLFILDNSLKPIALYNSNSGLRVDNIRSIYQDQNGSIWAGLDDGISKINENSKFKFYDLKSSNLNSRVRSLTIFQDHLYVGTNVNFKKLVLNKNNRLRENFIQIGKDKLNTQVWETFILDKKLLIGSNDGLGVIDSSDNYKQVINKKDIGIVFEIIESKIFKEYLLVRSKKGIFLINKYNLNDYKKIYQGSGVGYLTEFKERNEIWFRVSKKGIFRLKKEKDSINESKFDDEIFKKGKVKIFNLNNDLIIYADQSYLEYDFLKNGFNQSELFSKIINIENKNILDLKKTSKNSYWVTFTERINGKRVQEFYEIDSNEKILKLPFDNISHHLDTEFFFFNDLTLMSSNEGIVVINDKNFSKDQTGSIVISKITNNDQKVFFGAPNKDLVNNVFKIKEDFKYDQNKMSFTISLTDYLYENKNKYRYQLVGFDKKFSDFTNSHNITYTNLKPGKYDFKIQGLNSNGVLSDISNYSFSIDYPWWQSKTFYIIEFIFFSILLITTLFLKQTGKAAALATSISFMMILAFFEYINFVLDPIILDLSNGVPVFSIFSKVLLGLILLPLERFINLILDKMAKKIRVN